MNEIQRKRFRAGLIVFLIVYFCFMLGRGYFQNKTIIKRYADAKKVYEKQLEINKELELKLQQAHDDLFIELTARDKLGLVKPGEIAYKIVEED